MMGRTHMVFGFLAGLIFLPIFKPQHQIVFVVLATFASLWPDIDHEGSKINKIFPVTRIAAKLFKHRGFFHSIFPVAIIYGLGWYFGLLGFGIAIALGYVSHLVSDSITKMGVNLLHPIATLRVQGFLETGGMWELVALGVFAALAALKLWGMFF